MVVVTQESLLEKLHVIASVCIISNLEISVNL